ncbi:MAG TPA: hypothetical protein VJP77_09825, partial [Planctomycetota bacterium]|nr:hypothetical protein [Planctomycetota bacterium]
AVVALAAAPLPAQDGEGLEAFPAVDPYTQGDPERVARLGYVRLGGFVWLAGASTSEVQRELGDAPMLWVETEHFRIGSTLDTYDWSGDTREKSRFASQLGRLEERLGDLKAPRRELDPWLRLHLYAQLAEETYAGFVRDFDLDPAAWGPDAPHLGRPEKLLLLLCERDGEHARHAQVYLQAEPAACYRYCPWEGPPVFTTSLETLARGYALVDQPPLDLILQGQVVDGLAHLFVESYRHARGGAPYWLGKAYAHVAVRRVDPRWVTGVGLVEGQLMDEDDHEWEPRVRNLVKADYTAPARELFGWRAYADLDVRDHMVAWSKLEYLLGIEAGDRRGFLDDVCRPAPEGEPEAVAAALVERQVAALGTRFGLAPEAFDAD